MKINYIYLLSILGSTNSLKTPDSARFEDNKSSPLPNKEHQNSRSSQNSPAGIASAEQYLT